MCTSNPSPSLDPRSRWLFRLILLLAVLLRLTYLLEVTDAPDFAAPRFESQYHDYWARALVSSDWTPPSGVTDPEIRQRPFFRPPGYVYFLALIYRIGGPGYLLPRLAQMGLGLLTCWLLFRLGWRVYGEAAGLAAATMMATYWVSLFFEAEFMAPSLLLFLLTAWLSTVVRWREGMTFRWPLASGLLLGLTALVRPNVLILAPAALAWWVWILRRPAQPTGDRQQPTPWAKTAMSKASWQTAAVFLGAAVLAVLPATLRNAVVADDAVFVTSNAGINLFVGNNPGSDGFTPGVPELGLLLGDSGWDSFDQPKIVAAVSRQVGRPLKDSEVSRYFSRRAMQYMVSQPGAVLRLWGRKLLLFFGPAEISNTKILGMERRVSPTLGLGLDFATILALAIWGAASLVWRWRRLEAGAAALTLLLALCLVAFTLSYLPFFVSARFRLPMVPWLMLLGGAGVAILWQWLRLRRFRQLGWALLLLAGLRALTGIAWISYQPDEALWHSRRGLAFQANGQTDRAIESFQQSLEVDPQRLQVLLPLADSLVQAERFDDAVPVYQKALRLDPDNIAGHNNLAMVLARRGDPGAAMDHWRAVLRLDSQRLSALVNLAATLATVEDPALRDADKAVRLAERAVQLTGGRDPRALGVLATAYRAAGRDEDAAALRTGSSGFLP